MRKMQVNKAKAFVARKFLNSVVADIFKGLPPREQNQFSRKVIKPGMGVTEEEFDLIYQRDIDGDVTFMNHQVTIPKGLDFDRITNAVHKRVKTLTKLSSTLDRSNWVLTINWIVVY